LSANQKYNSLKEQSAIFSKMSNESLRSLDLNGTSVKTNNEKTNGIPKNFNLAGK
jgi:hypothetical protein